MTALVREWLLGVTGAAILAAVADSLMPEGGVKQVGRLVCGLVLLTAILRPLGGVKVTDFTQEWMYDGEQLRTGLQEEADRQMKAVIEERLASYSMDKAAQLGIPCQIRVECTDAGQGVFLPSWALVTTAADQPQRRALEELLCRDLGLEPGQVAYEEGPG